MLISDIIDRANAVRKKYSLNSVPVDLKKILSKEKIDSFEMDFAKYEASVKMQISGILIIDGNSRQILVNKWDNEKRKNFTVAHELGHYFLHYDSSKKDEVFVSFRGDSNPRETEANRFAAELLIPTEELKKELEENLFPTLTGLAGKFGVSAQTMGIQLNQKGMSFIGL